MCFNTAQLFMLIPRRNIDLLDLFVLLIFEFYCYACTEVYTSSHHETTAGSHMQCFSSHPSCNFSGQPALATQHGSEDAAI